jgi:hypothetical protein
MTHNPFEHDRDPTLGDLLRQSLEPQDHDGFVRAVMRRVRAGDTSWEVLSRWARPGLAAAAAFLLGVTFWFALNQRGEAPSLADAMRPGDAPAGLFSARQLDNDGVLQVVLER